ncbi:MAG TPA: molybdopterin cofactor-binding domain-containing protein [Gemmatimonadota bacterium]|nr:molybdopterin cofactor-binding domain-containing protein [Gemmatimonadota bacterium]
MRDLSRRGFVRLSVAAGGGLVVALQLPGCGRRREGIGLPGGGPSPATDVASNAWVELHPDGSTTITVGNSEMGQGVRTSLALLVAEELDLDWDRVTVAQAPNDPEKYGRQSTGGSASVRSAWEPLRRTGAAVRQVLLSAAATSLGVPASELETRDGSVRHPPSGREVSYGELAAHAASAPLPTDAEPKPPREWRLIGREGIVGVDVDDIVTGRAEFGSDVVWDGMLYAAVARSPAHGGSVKGYDDSKALAVPGVRKVVEVKGTGPDAHVRSGVAVLAEDTWSAVRGRDALRVDWDPGPHGGESSEAFSRTMRQAVSGPGSVVVNRTGDPDGVLERADEVVDATYELPFLSHATMEPQTCVAEVADGKVRLRSPAQTPDWSAGAAASALGVDADDVELTIPLLGGGFGRRLDPDFSVEAALIAREAGAPVKVVWTREDDMRHDFYRPCAVHRFEASLGSDGYPEAWRHRFSTPAISATYDPDGDEEDWGVGEGTGTATMLYRVPNRSSEYTHLPCGLTRGWWRAVSTTHGIFARECFMDELAERAGIDPVEYRLHLIDTFRMDRPKPNPRFPHDPERLKGVLRLAAEKAGWGKDLPEDRAMGVACGIDHLSYAAEVIEVSRSGSGFRIERVVCAADCGPVVNPDGGRAQIEGAIHQGLSAALGERITVRNGAVREGNFDGYPILSIDRAPREIEVHFAETDAHPTGLGEPALPPAAPALANALYRLTGRRIRSLPIEA